jgi:hypothetical protein
MCPGLELFRTALILNTRDIIVTRGTIFQKQMETPAFIKVYQFYHN